MFKYNKRVSTLVPSVLYLITFITFFRFRNTNPRNLFLRVSRITKDIVKIAFCIQWLGQIITLVIILCCTIGKKFTVARF